MIPSEMRLSALHKAKVHKADAGTLVHQARNEAYLNDHHRSLPEDLVWEILSKLPFDSVARSSCLCKSWYNWIKDNHILSGLMVLHRCGDKYQIRNHDSKNMICPVNLPQDLSLQVVGESDGILCFQDVDPDNRQLHLYNPSTREYRKLPPPIMPYGHPVLGFGFITGNSDYRIIRICNSKRRKTMAEIYKLSTNCWSELDPGDFRLTDSVCFERFCVNVNGCCYWLCYRSGSRRSIVTFNFRTESFGRIRDPEPWDFERSKYRLRNLAVLDDSCAVCSLTMDGEKTEVCVVSEFENTDTYYWTKKFTIKSSCLGWGCAAWVHDSKIFQIESGEVSTLLAQEEDGAQTKMFKVDDVYYGSVVFKPTLFRFGTGLYLQ